MINAGLLIGNSPQALGCRIERARMSLGLTLEMVAEMAGVHHSQISRIERGQFRLIGKNVLKICSTLHVDPHGIDHEFLCARIRSTIRSPEAARAINAFLDVVEATECR